MSGIIQLSIIAFAIVGIAALYKHTGGKYPVAWVFLGIFVVIITFFVSLPITSCVINSTQGRSRVDVSPLEQLTAEEISSIEEVIARMEFSDFITTFRDPQELELNSRIDRRYNLSRGGGPTGRSLGIQVYVFYQERYAIERIESHRRRYDSTGRNYTETMMGNGIEVTLRPPYMMTSASGCYAPNNRRTIISYIRMEHVVIQLWEYRQAGDRRDDFSSDFIALLAEMLQEVE